MKELRLINVNKKYKLSNKETFQALYDINVNFKKGELVSIIGESGSGKSTLMNLIGGLDSDFTGDIISGGENLRKLTDKQLDKYRKNKVGFVFQSFNLISHLSILDNVTLSLTLSNVNEKEKVERATKILERVGLSDQLKKKPNQLSGGQKQRVAIARALINDPEIIIADEPTGALDSETSMQILEILKEIADNGKLVIMVTHSEKVASISSRVVEIADGRIINDYTNENYKKNKIKKEEKLEEPVQDTDEKKKSFKNYKDKQNLSLWQAIKLSFHNMWASKTKNLLMAFGVAIGIGSLILMLCFSSGITDFIDNTMTSYSDPTIATIKKKTENIQEMVNFDPFSDDEISALKKDLNDYLSEKNIDFEITDENDNVETHNMDYGIQMMAMAFDAKIIFQNPENPIVLDTPPTKEQLEQVKENGGGCESIIYLYTIPPYYTDANVLEGKMSTSEKGIMITPGLRKLFTVAGVESNEIVGKKADVYLTVPPTATSKALPLPFMNQEVTGIMDTSVMSGLNVLYIDYDYLGKLFASQNAQDLFAPNTLYIKTPSAEVVAAINDYLAKEGKYSGAIEEQLAGMFSNMTSVIGTSLIVISCISLLVSAMMILVVLYMSVTERTKEIGVLKSIGARRKDIKRIFTSESFLVGVLSGLCGIVFNLVLTLIVYFVLQATIGLAPISYRWWYFALALGISILISMLSGLYPASKAAKLDPVESLRRE